MTMGYVAGVVPFGPKHGDSAELSAPFLTAFSCVLGVLSSAASWYSEIDLDT